MSADVVILIIVQPSIVPLVSLLHDDESKTRANAAGALGNLVRRKSSLIAPSVSSSPLSSPLLLLLLLPLLFLILDYLFFSQTPLSPSLVIS